MVRCPRCGSEISEERSARFCPNCGSPLSKSMVSLSTRAIVLVTALILCISATLAGTFARVDMEEAQELKREVDKLINCTKSTGFQAIFGRNFMHTLIMFTPVAGPFWGFFALYNTGRVIAALSMTNGVSPVQLMLAFFLLPFTWMEYISYALAISESIILAYSMLKRNLREESSTAFKLLALCAVILLVAAVIEFAMISIVEAS